MNTQEKPRMTLLIFQPVETIRDVSEKAVVIQNGDFETVLPVSQIQGLSTLLRRSYKITFGEESPNGVLIPKWLIEKKTAEDKANGKTPFPFDTTTAAWLIGNVIEWIAPKPKTVKK
jgi:hypothetical protein